MEITHAKSKPFQLPKYMIAQQPPNLVKSSKCLLSLPRKPPQPTHPPTTLPLEAKPRKSPLVSKSRKNPPPKNNNNNNNRFWKHPPNNWSQKHPTTTTTTTAAAAANRSLHCTYTLYWGLDTEESLLRTLEKGTTTTTTTSGHIYFWCCCRKHTKRERERKMKVLTCYCLMCNEHMLWWEWMKFSFFSRRMSSYPASQPHTHPASQGNFLCLNPSS